jgi:hypothetical protein
LAKSDPFTLGVVGGVENTSFSGDKIAGIAKDMELEGQQERTLIKGLCSAAVMVMLMMARAFIMPVKTRTSGRCQRVVNSAENSPPDDAETLPHRYGCRSQFVMDLINLAALIDKSFLRTNVPDPGRPAQNARTRVRDALPSMYHLKVPDPGYHQTDYSVRNAVAVAGFHSEQVIDCSNQGR